MNNSVGYARPAAWPGPVVLGSDGIGADMLEEFRLAYARSREADIDRRPGPAWEWVAAGWQLVPEARADRVRWSYDGVDDPWRLAFTPGVRAVDVWVDGEQVLRVRPADQSGRRRGAPEGGRTGRPPLRPFVDSAGPVPPLSTPVVAWRCRKCRLSARSGLVVIGLLALVGIEHRSRRKWEIAPKEPLRSDLDWH